MKQAALFMRVIGVFYLLNLLLLWPGVWATQLPVLYPGVNLHIGEPVFDLLLNAWLIVGLGLCAIGLVLLYGANNPEKYLALVPVVIITEVLFTLWDIYSTLYGHEVLWVAIVTVVIHLLIIPWGIFILRTTSSKSVSRITN